MSDTTTPNAATVNPTASVTADKAARDAAVKQADNFFKTEIKEAPKGNPEDLFKKFGAKTTEDAKEFQQKIEQEKEIKAAEVIDNTEIKTTPETDEKKPGFIKSLKQTNEQLAKEAAELRSKVSEYEKSKAEIEELRVKLDESETKKEALRLQKELATAIQEKQDREAALNKELEEVRRANAFLNLPSDPVFKENFDAPIFNGVNQVRMILGDDQASLTEFEKALASYEASLRSPDPTESARQREVSKQTLNSIYENLQPFDQAKFNQTAYDVLNKVEKRVEALKNWEVTKASTDEEKNRRALTSRAQVSKRWNDAYSAAKASLDEAIKYPEEIAKIIASQQIDDDTTEDEMIAEAALRENSSFAPEQITRILQQGAKFKKQKAYTFALEKQVNELNETIKKMRGSSTAEGSIGSSSSGKSSEVEEKTPSALFAKFANRK